MIDRDTKAPTLYVLAGGEYRVKAPEGSGWLRSDTTGLELRVAQPAKMSIRLAGDESTRQQLP